MHTHTHTRTRTHTHTHTLYVSSGGADWHSRGPNDMYASSSLFVSSSSYAVEELIGTQEDPTMSESANRLCNTLARLAEVLCIIYTYIHTHAYIHTPTHPHTHTHTHIYICNTLATVQHFGSGDVRLVY